MILKLVLCLTLVHAAGEAWTVCQSTTDCKVAGQKCCKATKEKDDKMVCGDSKVTSVPSGTFKGYTFKCASSKASSSVLID